MSGLQPTPGTELSDVPEVSIIVVTCDRRALLERCLASVDALDLPAERREIVVYDNGSSDGTREWLARAHPDARLIAGTENRGFAAPCNRAAEAAQGELLCFLNNDLLVTPDLLRELVRARAATGAACVGARILTEDGRRIEFDGGTMSFYGHGAPARHGMDAAAFSDEREPHATLFACGGAMLVDRRVFLDAGGFDETYFAYFEDVDLGWRLWALGERCAHAPAARAFHGGHGSEALLGEGRRVALLERNALLSVFKNYEPGRAQRMFACALALLGERARLDAGRAKACLQGQDEALSLLEPAERAHRAIAARRTRTDREIAPLFIEPWRPAIGGEVYRRRQHEIARTFGVEDLFDGVARAEVASCE